MSRFTQQLSKSLSLRAPQRESLEALERVVGAFSLSRDLDLAQVLAIARAENPTFTDFERAFPSYTFALATGVGKTRLMGAFIAWLWLTKRSRNFFVLAPGKVIYQKLIEDFTPNTLKYVFAGLAEFVAQPPVIVTGENYTSGEGANRGQLRLGAGARDEAAHINIFNIGKISEKASGTSTLKIRQLSEFIGESYFDYLRGLPDLVLLMDESHHYRRGVAWETLQDLNPVLGLELTATPFVQKGSKTENFKNVLYEFSLKDALDGGFVKEPACTRRENVDTEGMDEAALEQMKLEDGLTLHETTLVNLEIYAAENGVHRVKPFVLIVARNKEHAYKLRDHMATPEFRGGRYIGKVIVVECSLTGEERDLYINTKLRNIQSVDEPTEVVIHVQMLKEGWDVNNLYTIIPFNAAYSRTLVEQTIGRGLRLPYGKRVGDDRADQLVVVAHEHYQRIIDDAKKADSPFRMKSIILGPNGPERAPKPTVVPSGAAVGMGLVTAPPAVPGKPVRPLQPMVVPDGMGQEAAKRVASAALAKASAQPSLFTPTVSSVAHGSQSPMAGKLATAVLADLTASGLAEGITRAQALAIVDQTLVAIVKHTIEVPKIVVTPSDDARFDVESFHMNMAGVDWVPVDNVLLIQPLHDDKQAEKLEVDRDDAPEESLANYVVRGVIDEPAVDYAEHAELLHTLAEEILVHLRTYLNEEQVRRVVVQRQAGLASKLLTQFLDHGKMVASGYVTTVTTDSVGLKPAHVAIGEGEAVLDVRQAPVPLNTIKSRVFGGFSKCLLDLQKFDSDGERRLAVMLEDADATAVKWVKPSPGSFAIFMPDGGRYDPDFVVETTDARYIVEVKAEGEIPTKPVQDKAEVSQIPLSDVLSLTLCGGRFPPLRREPSSPSTAIGR